jgi:hypothetical protein
MNFYELQEKVSDLVEEYISKMEVVNAVELGLDIRAGYTLYVNTTDDIIACYVGHRRALDYYGGFEYVESHDVEVIGDYVFYTGGSGRVQDCLEYFNENKENV